MRISELTKKLNQLKKQFGDVQVVLASDSEGNSFGSIDHTCFSYEDGSFANGRKAIIVNPNCESELVEECVDWEEKYNPRIHKEKLCAKN